MGWETSLGSGVDSVWDRMLDGETGIKPLDPGHPVPASKGAPAPLVEGMPDPAKRVRHLAVEATRRTMEQAGLGDPPEGAWLVLGTCMGARFDDPDILESGMHEWAKATGTALGFPEDRIVSLSTACSSGSDTVVVGRELLRSGKASTCVCGGVDVVTEAKAKAHTDLGTLTTEELKPFDQHRTGTIFGEGAGVLVLEETRGPDQHQDRPRIAGTGSANDAEGLTHPDHEGKGARLAIQRSLSDAGLEPDGLDVVNAHGSGTPVNDRLEGANYSTLFSRGSEPTVFATKGALGHTLGATGSLELISTIKALEEGTVPPVVGLETPIDVPFPLPVNGPQDVEGSLGLSLTLGFGGFNTSLVVEVPS